MTQQGAAPEATSAGFGWFRDRRFCRNHYRGESEGPRALKQHQLNVE